MNKLESVVLQRVRLTREDVLRLTGQPVVPQKTKPPAAPPRYHDGDALRQTTRKMRHSATHMGAMRIMGYPPWLIAETYGVSDECVLIRLRKLGLTSRRPKGGRSGKAMLGILPVRSVRTATARRRAASRR